MQGPYSPQASSFSLKQLMPTSMSVLKQQMAGSQASSHCCRPVLLSTLEAAHAWSIRAFEGGIGTTPGLSPSSGVIRAPHAPYLAQLSLCESKQLSVLDEKQHIAASHASSHPCRLSCSEQSKDRFAGGFGRGLRLRQGSYWRQTSASPSSSDVHVPSKQHSAAAQILPHSSKYS